MRSELFPSKRISDSWLKQANKKISDQDGKSNATSDREN